MNTRKGARLIGARENNTVVPIPLHGTWSHSTLKSDPRIGLLQSEPNSPLVTLPGTFSTSNFRPPDIILQARELQRPDTGNAKPKVVDVMSDKAAESHIDIVDTFSLDVDDAISPATVMKEGSFSQKSSAASFWKAFHEQHPGGTATVGNLKAVLKAVGLDVSEDQVENAMRQLCGEEVDLVMPVHFDRAAEIHQLLSANNPKQEVPGDDVPKQGCLPCRTDGMTENKATNVLLAIVVTLSFFGAFLVAGLSIVLMLMSSTTMLNQHMREDLTTIRDVLDVYTTDIFAVEIENRLSDISSMVAIVASDVGYRAIIETSKRNLMLTAISTAEAAEEWWKYQPAGAFADTAKMMGSWTERAIRQDSQAEAATSLQQITQQLPAGYELLLGKWADATNTSVQFLTTPRYPPSQVDPCHSASHVECRSPMATALSGSNGALQGIDYRNQSVLVGYAYLAGGLGLEYKADRAVVLDGKYKWLKNFFDAQNANAKDSREFILGDVDDGGNRRLLTHLKSCGNDEDCETYVLRPGGPLSRALDRQTGVMEDVGYDGMPIIAAYTWMGSTELGLVVQMLKDEFVKGIIQDMAETLDSINEDLLNGTSEVELFALNGTGIISHLTRCKFASECPQGQCVVPDYAINAQNNCTSGMVRTKDYRNKAVAVGYFCVAELDALISMKIDVSELGEESLQTVINAINTRNNLDTDNSCEFLVSAPKPGLSPAQVKDFSDIQLMTEIKYPQSCIYPDCHWDRESALVSVMDDPAVVPGVIRAHDYRNVPIVAAVDFMPEVGGGVGLALEIDDAEYMAPILNTAVYVLVFAGAMSLGCTVVLVVMTKRMMRSMISASEEGKQAIETEKQRFSAVVASMYPKYVVPRLLAGEQNIVDQIPNAAVFFSDVYDFTSASNNMRSEELLDFMGYIYGVMDVVAERFGVYKVKTIGDAYLAVAGLPGVEEKATVTTHPCLDLLYFASCVAQIFSHKFHHPEKGKILAVVSKARVPSKRRLQPQNWADDASVAATSKFGRATTTRTVAISNVPSTVLGSQQDGVNTARSGSTLSRDTTTVFSEGPQCTMSYGLACGTVIAGVLQGKNPMFDIWGKTVNLASRMESTGQPGRIQVPENYYKKVMAIEGQPFEFETGRTAYCKGFGAVKSYFVLSSDDPPSKELMVQLGLKTRYTPFVFENILNTLQAKQAPDKAQGPSEQPSQVPTESAPRHDPRVVHKGNHHIAVLDYDDS